MRLVTRMTLRRTPLALAAAILSISSILSMWLTPYGAVAAPRDPDAVPPLPAVTPTGETQAAEKQFKYHFNLDGDNAALPAGLADSDGAALAPRGRGWACLEPGLCYGEFADGGSGVISAVRIDPRYFDLMLCSAGMDGDGSHTLAEWGQKYGLAAAVNASMYLKDGLTSTGYMREGDYVNNGRVVGRLGAFLVSGPDTAHLPLATIVDKDMEGWEDILGHYRMVVQNYRIVNAQRRILWAPGGPLYSISAIALDGEGHILFLHSRERVEAYTFAQRLLHLPLDIRTVMYVEGGGQAGLFVRSGSMVKEIQGQSVMDFLVTGYLSVRLPNVIGARRHTPAEAGEAVTGEDSAVPGDAPVPGAGAGE